MSSHRMEKVNELVREEVSKILLLESRDPRFVSVTVTGVKVTPDLNFAKVYVSILGTVEERDSILSALGKASGFVRHQLGQQVRMKRTPQLTFLYDESLEYANQIYKTLEQLDLGDEGTETEETI